MNEPNTPNKRADTARGWSHKLRQRSPRLTGWILITLALLVCVGLVAPQQLPVSLYKLSLVSLAAVVGYWLDRSLFPYARPDMFMDLADGPDDWMEGFGPEGFNLELTVTPEPALLHLMGVAMLRRAIIVGCAMLAMGLGA